LFAPTLMADRIVVLEKLYPWLDSRGLDYFRGRLVQAPRDSEFGLQYVVAHCVTRESQDRAAEALALKCQILWGLLDAVHYAYVSPGYLPPLWHDSRKL